MHKLTNEVLAIAERVYERIKKAERQYQLTENTTWPLRYYEYNADIEDEKDYKILEKLFYDIENDVIKVDYVISISPIMQAASGIRLDRAEKEIVGDLGFAQIAKINPTLAIQNIKAFKKLAEGLELSQEDFV